MAAANGSPPCSGLLQTISPTLSVSMARSPDGVATIVPAAKQQGPRSSLATTPLSSLLATPVTPPGNLTLAAPQGSDDDVPETVPGIAIDDLFTPVTRLQYSIGSCGDTNNRDAVGSASAPHAYTPGQRAELPIERQAEVGPSGTSRDGFAEAINRLQIPTRGGVSVTSVGWVSFQPMLTYTKALFTHSGPEAAFQKDEPWASQHRPTLL